MMTFSEPRPLSEKSQVIYVIAMFPSLLGTSKSNIGFQCITIIILFRNGFEKYVHVQLQDVIILLCNLDALIRNIDTNIIGKC